MEDFKVFFLVLRKMQVEQQQGSDKIKGSGLYAQQQMSEEMQQKYGEKLLAQQQNSKVRRQ